MRWGRPVWRPSQSLKSPRVDHRSRLVQSWWRVRRHRSDRRDIIRATPLNRRAVVINTPDQAATAVRARLTRL
jgi:hypothetical protein